MRTAFALVVILASGALSAEERTSVLVRDGWPEGREELPDILAPGEVLWAWSDTCPPQRLHETAQLSCEAADEIELRIAVPERASSAGVEVRWGTEAMLREIPDDLLPMARTSEGGVVELRVPKGEPVFARAAGPVLATAWRRVTNGELLQATPAVRPSVTLMEDGKPAMRGRIEIRASDVTESQTEPFRGAAAERILIPPIPAQSYVRVIAWSDTGLPAIVNGRAEAIPELIELARGHLLEGRVLDADETALADAVVTVLFTIPRDRIDLRKVNRTGETGRFAIAGLPSGDTEVVISREPYARSARIVRIAGDLDLGSLTLQPARDVLFRIVSAQGSPIKGALVRTSDGIGADSDEKGLTLLRSLPLSSLDARVTAKGYLPADITVESDARQPVVVSLERAVHVRARLVDAAGLTTVNGGTISVNLSGRTSIVEFEGDRFEIDNLDAGLLSLEIRAASLSPFRVPEREVSTGELVDLGMIALDRGLAMTGRAIDAQSQTPLSGVNVRVLRPNPHGALLSWFRRDFVSAESDDEGRFRISGLAPATYSLWTEASGRAPRIRTNLELAGDESGGELDLGDLMIEEGRSLVVTCTPVARCGTEAAITLPQAEWFPFTSPMREGRAEILPLPGGTATLRLSDRGGVIHQRELTIGPDDVTEVRVRLEGTTVEGSVLRGGKPVRGGSIAFVPPEDGSRFIQVAHRRSAGVISNEIVGNIPRRVIGPVDDDGRFELTDVAPGEYTVTWSSAGSPSVPRRVQVPEGVSRVPIRIELGTSGLAGSVRRKDGLPAAGVSVTARTSSGNVQTMTGSAGTFSFGALDPGETDVRAISREHGSAETVVDLREGRKTEVDLTLADSVDDLRLLVLSRGSPVANAFVFIRTNGRISSVTTGADGRATVRQIETKGTREFAVYSGQMGWSFVAPRSAAEKELTIQMSAEGTRLTVSSAASGPLMVVAPSGFPIHEALAILGSRPFARPDVPVTINRLPPGTYQLSLGSTVRHVTLGFEPREIRF
jgi:hypothetical protein